MPEFINGFKILTEGEQTAKSKRGAFSVSVSIDNPKKVKANIKEFNKFDKYYKELYLKLTLEVHKYLIRLTPLHTGKLRGGWTALLDKYQVSYGRQIFDKSLYSSFKSSNRTPAYRQYDVSQSAVEEGKQFSKLEDNLPNDTDISIDNQVEYKDHLDFGTSEIQARHFTDIALYKGEAWFQRHFEEWIAKMEKAGAVVPPPKVREIDN